MGTSRIGRSLGLATLAFGPFFVGCGAATDHSSLTGGALPGRILLAGVGGNTSCKPDSTGASTPYGMKMFAPFKQLADSLHADQGLEVDFFLSCHESDATVHYFASDQPTKLVDIPIDAVAGTLNNLLTSRGS